MPETAYIYDAVRTPRGKGKKDGSLHEVKPVDLLGGLLDSLRERHPDMDPAGIEDIVLGCVTPVGDQGADIARTAALNAGLPYTATGLQVNRYCASGLTAVNAAEQVADDAIAQEAEDTWVAEQVAAGHPVDGLFPLNAEWRAKYEAATGSGAGS